MSNENNNNGNINPELLNILAGFTTEQQKEIMDRFAQMNEAKQQAAPAPTEAPPEMEAQPDYIGTPDWLLNAIDSMTLLDRRIFCARLLNELHTAKDDVTRTAIRKYIDDIRVNDARWEYKTKPFILSYKKWANTPAGKAAERAFLVGLKTRTSTTTAVKWTGKQIQRFGQAVVNSADPIGRMTAAPINALGHMMGKKPQEAQAVIAEIIVE